ncbi:MAG: hypothetical protein EZS28_013672 [Streblomastix strix]|uniref:Tyr recombinase domain-containing protein n=1 Tax=Streblomastix strix TaxID=222440 RepID=A0A5J4W7E1_9EUKA|nr:MAG: hypothetical protein EZS28_013672 [Streblomastix strix]
MWISKQTLGEIHWWRKTVHNNHPKHLIFLQPEAVLTTDASETQWGGALQLIKTGQTVRLSGNCYNNPKWKLTSSNQRELAAILLGIQNNSTAIFDLRRGAAAPALCKQVDQILQTLENMKIQFSAFHIPEKDNKEANSLSRLSTRGNYGIRTEILDETLQELAMQPTVDYFTNRRNRKCRRFYSLIWDPWAQGQDGMKANWKKETPLLHARIPLIQRVLNKVRKDQTEAVLIVPYWQTQSWWTDIQELMIKLINLGKSSDVLVVGKRMLKQKRHLPPGDVLIAHIKEKEAKNSLNKSQHKEVQLKKQPTIQLGAGMVHGEDTSKDQANSSITGKVQAGNGKIRKINGKMLEQIMKKHRAAIRKVHKEEPIYHLDDLLKILDQKAQTIDQLTEDILLGCTRVTIIAFSELILEKVMRAIAEKIIDNSWIISTSIFKKPIQKVTLTFRQTSTPSTSSVFWQDNWTKMNGNRLKPTMLWYLTKTNRVASTQQTSRAAHAIINLAGINKSHTIISIRSSSITKAVDQGATPYQINRFSRHKGGPYTVQQFYDKNLNDDIRERLGKL